MVCRKRGSSTPYRCSMRWAIFFSPVARFATSHPIRSITKIEIATTVRRERRLQRKVIGALAGRWEGRTQAAPGARS